MTAGTIFQDTRLPLRTWYRAMWWVTSQKNGAVLWDCKAFWVWEATAPPGRCCTSCGARWCGLAANGSGRVEVDETYVGGEEEGLHRRRKRHSIAAEEDPT